MSLLDSDQATHWRYNNSAPLKCHKANISRHGPMAADCSQHSSPGCFHCYLDRGFPRFEVFKSVLTWTLRMALPVAAKALGVLVVPFPHVHIMTELHSPGRSISAASPCCLHSLGGKGKQDPPKRELAFSHCFPSQLVFSISLVEPKGS